MQMRFIVPASAVEASGFHVPASAAEANGILNYLRRGSPPIVQGDNRDVAEFAKAVFSFSHEHKSAGDQRSRQKLTRSVSGLAGELAAALKITLRASARLIQKNLGDVSKINPSVLSALEHLIQG